MSDFSLLATMQLLEMAKEACPHEDCHVDLSLSNFCLDDPMIKVAWRYSDYGYNMLIDPRDIESNDPLRMIGVMFASAKRSMQINKELGERKLSSSIPQRIMDDIALHRRFEVGNDS